MFTFFGWGDQNGRKVVCGSQTGIILLYSWGCFKDCRYMMWNVSELNDENVVFLEERGRETLIGCFP